MEVKFLLLGLQVPNKLLWITESESSMSTTLKRFNLRQFVVLTSEVWWLYPGFVSADEQKTGKHQHISFERSQWMVRGLDWRSAQMPALMTALIPQKKIPIMRQSPRSLLAFLFFCWPDCWVLLYPDAGVGVAEVAGVGGAGWVWQRGVQQAAVRAAGRGAVRVVAFLQTGGGDDIFTWFSHFITFLFC